MISRANPSYPTAEDTTDADRDLVTEPPKDDLVRYLEDRFACAQSCTECARACALLVSTTELGTATLPVTGSALPEPARARDGAGAPYGLRRALLLCVEVCDATCRLLSEEVYQDEYGVRLQVEWCRAVALECAHACDRAATGEECAACAAMCRACARACTDFLAILL